MPKALYQNGMLKYELKQSLRSGELSKDWEGWQNGYCAGLENLWAKALRGSSPLPSAMEISKMPKCEKCAKLRAIHNRKN